MKINIITILLVGSITGVCLAQMTDNATTSLPSKTTSSITNAQNNNGPTEGHGSTENAAY